AVTVMINSARILPKTFIDSPLIRTYRMHEIVRNQTLIFVNEEGQFDSNNQSRLGVLRPDAAIMRNNRAVGDRKSQAHAASRSIPRVIDTKEWLKDFVERIRRDPRSVIPNRDASRGVVGTEFKIDR